eukprot:1158369-Pelagomonas_calceolata.AAC.14
MQWVPKWQLQTEKGMRASGKPGMADAQIADFTAKLYCTTVVLAVGVQVAAPGRGGHARQREAWHV